MDGDIRPVSASGPSPDVNPSSPPNGQSSNNALHKLPPCDQCRRRKVKCQQNNEDSCDRCIQSSLSCTREIVRKKRGPKKGSGSVIARLRGEGEHPRAQETGLPPFNMLSLQRTYTAESLDSSPVVSPVASHFSEYGGTPDAINMPRSVPLGFGDEISPLGDGGFSHGALQFPSAWQMNEDQPLLQYPPPTSASGYVSVNDLAHQIFQEPTPANPPMYSPSGMAGAPLGTPHSLDAILTGSVPSANVSEAVSDTSSPHPQHGPKYLYRSNSGALQAEPRLMALASEIGFSGYLMSQCIKQWFRVIYPIQPILHEPTITKLLNQPEELSIQDKILILSLCSVTVLHAAPPSDLSLQHKQDLGRELLKQCLHLRHTYEWIETANLTTVISSFFICITYFELKQVRSHHFFLREAIGLAREMNPELEGSTTDPIESICRKRMLALLFITERGCAILRNKPISMMRLPTVPRQYFDNHDELVLAGFTQLCNLFSVLDDKFVEVWYQDDSENTPFQNIAAIQHELNQLDFMNTEMTDIQKADVLITHQWLRLIFWQASMRQGLINSSSTDEIFFYNYPIVIAKDLCRVMRGLQYDAIQVHGLGIFEKVFEVAYTLLDALTIAKLDWSMSDELRYLFSCLSASPNSHNTYVKVLENKINLENNGAASPLSQLG